MLLTAYALQGILGLMEWVVAFHEALADEFLQLDRKVRQELAARVTLLKQFGPHLRRPYADTLNGLMPTR